MTLLCSEGLNCDGNVKEEPKHIVFLSKILTLFSICFVCKGDSPIVVAKQKGTMLFVTATCTNLQCGEVFRWRSQPDLPGTKIPAGNILVSMGILCAGGSFTKFKTVFNHIGLACISRATYFSHQKERLFPAIYLYWKRYQKTLIDQIKTNHAEVVMADDGRHDSMGHSAKYGAYTMFCCTMPSIVHFELVQKNEAASSQAMELLGFQRAMDQFLQYGIDIKAFVSDQHLAIAKHIRENYPSVCH